MTFSPVLEYPQFEKLFMVDTDANNKMPGEILSHEQGRQKKVIAYFSKTLSKPEENYYVTRHELLDIV